MPYQTHPIFPVLKKVRQLHFSCSPLFRNECAPQVGMKIAPPVLSLAFTSYLLETTRAAMAEQLDPWKKRVSKARLCFPPYHPSNTYFDWQQQQQQVERKPHRLARNKRPRSAARLWATLYSRIV